MKYWRVISDRYILRIEPNFEFHINCLKCVDCQRPLDESCSVFVRNGRTYCRDDYLRSFSRKCQRCEGPLGPTDMVMRVRDSLYHQHCFSCFHCGQQLLPGTQFVAKGAGQIYCPNDCFRASCSESDDFFVDSKSCKTDIQDDLRPPSFPSINQHTDSLSSTSSTSSVNGSARKTTTNSRKSRKDKPIQRVRTVLSEKQLQILKHMYQLNQRPDTSTKEKLVAETGLSQRVIRVWFQNKRCKDKKKQNAIREQQQHQEKEQALHGVRISGVGPIMATSPTTMLDNNMMHPIEIQQYQQSTNLWGNGTPTPPQDMSYHQNSVMVNPPAYGDLPALDVPSGDYGHPFGQEPFNGQFLPSSSLSSSPACSD
uniref:LIM/homeobox protein Lhx1 n=1 Tax=Bursaphelenchus xylophilus TaxID=6326 RepID=A0A1I7S1Y2_BURXY